MNVILNDEGYTSDGKWRLVPSEYMESLTLPNPPAELAISGKPVAMVDAGDDGYFAEILPDCSVSVGDQLYAFPPLSVDPALWKASFDQWWEAHGQYLRAGGGQYEKTFGYHAWEAAAALYAAPNPPQSLSAWQPIATAPKDGSAVILRNEHGGVIVALFRDVYPSGFRPNSPWQSLMLNHNYLPSAMRFGAPTHWMPLPEPAP